MNRNANGPTQDQGMQIPALPDSIRTHFLGGGGLWHVDEDVQTVVEKLEEFLQSSEPTLWLHADHRLMAFSRSLLVQTDGRPNWTVVWTARREVEVVNEPSAVQRLNRR